MGLAHSETLGRLVDNPFARYTARISFGIYIWHYLLLEGFSHITGGRFFVYGAIAEPRTVRVKRVKSPVRRSITPRKSPEMPTGQVAGVGRRPI